jgi:predicted AAA+ superfamily ATPase
MSSAGGPPAPSSKSSTPRSRPVQAGRSFADARADGETWGHLVESTVGAHLANAAASGDLELSWWREGDREVDFVLSGAGGLAAIEVNSGQARASQRVRSVTT